MASALVNNVSPAAPDAFLGPPPSAAGAAAFSSYDWLSPRISFGHEFDEDGDHVAGGGYSLEKPGAEEEADLDFEFGRVDDPVVMLPADELFSDGKLVPRQLASVRPPLEATASSASAVETQSPEPEKTMQKADAAPSDPYTAFSPKAPTCTSRWRELLRLKRAAQSAAASQPEVLKSPSKCSSSSAAAAAAVSSNGVAARSLMKHLLHRTPRSSSPMVDSVSESRHSAPVSLSSSSSAATDHDDHARLSLDSEKPGEPSNHTFLGQYAPPRIRLAHGPPKVVAGGRVGRQPTRRAAGDAAAVPPRSASVDSPRMNSSGKVVFQGLGRSSSSPGAFTGGPRGRPRGGERPHPAAATVRVAPILNVPVSMFGLGQLFSTPQKKDPAAGSASAGAIARSSSGAARA